MKARLLCVGWLVAILAATGLASPVRQEPTGAATAVFWALPGTVEVGEPFRWIVEVRHPQGHLRGLTEQLALFAEGLDASWVLLATDDELTTPDPERGDWVRTRAGWTAVSLEPGTRELPDLELLVGDGRIPVRGATLEVAGVLAEGEDEARPARGLRTPPVGEESARFGAPALAAGAFATAALAWWVLRRKGAVSTEAEPNALATLNLLLVEADDAPPEGSAAVDFAYELSAGLRRVFDQRAERDLRGLTDGEWVAAVQTAGAAEAQRAVELNAFLARCTEVEHGALAPSPWALRELVDEARRLLQEGPSPAEVKP